MYLIMDNIVLETRQDLKNYLANTPCDVTILKFGATWCKPCNTIAPFVDMITNEYLKKNINFEFIEIDVDSAMDLYAFLKKTKMINGIPAFLSYKKSLYKEETFFIPYKSTAGADQNLIRNFYKDSLGI